MVLELYFYEMTVNDVHINCRMLHIQWFVLSSYVCMYTVQKSVHYSMRYSENKKV